MPTKRKRVEVLLDDKELQAIKKAAWPLSPANYFRQLAGLPPLERGAAAHKKGNAKKHNGD